MADKDFIINTELNYQKILHNGSYSQSVPSYPSDPGSFTYTHGLGYIPSARVWVESSSGKWFPASNIQLLDHSTGASPYTATYYLTSTTLVVVFDNSSGATATVNFRVRVYIDD